MTSPTHPGPVMLQCLQFFSIPYKQPKTVEVYKNNNNNKPKRSKRPPPALIPLQTETDKAKSSNKVRHVMAMHTRLATPDQISTVVRDSKVVSKN